MSEQTQRLFFALWPDAATRQGVVRILHSLPRKQGKPVAPEKLHITLAFIGSVESHTRDCLADHARGVVGEAFTIALLQLGFFRRSRVLWLGSQTCPPPLRALVEQLNACLTPCGYRPEPRPYHPHLTLFRKASPVRSPLALTPLTWQVDSFCLVESVSGPNGARYEILQRYPLLRAE